MNSDVSESQQWEIYTNLHQGDVNYVRFTELGLNGKKMVDIYGVVTSISVSKCGGSASHKFCFSITLVDPSLEQLYQSIRLNWFANFNTLNVQVGDIIRCVKLKVQHYRDYPQFTGNSHHSPMVIFRFNRDSVSGAPLVAPVDNLNHEEMITNLVQNKTRVLEVSCGNWSRILPIEGDIALNTLSPRDVHFVLMLHKWAEKAFYEQTLAEDAVPDIPIHAALAYLNKQQSEVYCNLQPPADPLLLRMPSTPLTVERCNLVAMIVGVLPSRSGDAAAPPEGLLLWDGTARGMLNLPPAAPGQARVDAALHAAKDYSCFEKHADMAQAQARIARYHFDGGASTSVPLVGSPLLVKSGDIIGSELLASRKEELLPGTWIRVRNLHIELNKSNGGAVNSSTSSSGATDVKYATVHADSHISILQPFYHDVAVLAGTYYRRAINLMLSEHAAQTAASTTAAAAPSTAANSRGVKRRADGAHITWLAMMLVKDLPAVHDTHCRIVAWFPEQVDKFVHSPSVPASGDENVNNSNEPANMDSQLLFSLRIADETEELDVVLSGADAELFLGVSTTDFVSNVNNIQEKVRTRLEELRTSNEERDFTLLAYSVEEEVLAWDKTGRRKVPQMKHVRRFTARECRLFA